MNKFNLAALLLCATAAAAQEPVSALAPEPEIGTQTRQWLELQRSGRQATPVRDRLSPEAAGKVDRRRVDSFAHPVPEYFADEAFGEE